MTVRAANDPFEGTTLDVAAKRSCAPQWRAFMEALSTTLSEMAGDELALRILGGVGAAIAKQQPVPVCSSLQATRPGLTMRLVDRGRGAYPPLVFRYERINST